MFIFIDPCISDTFEAEELNIKDNILWDKTDDYAINMNLLNMGRYKTPYEDSFIMSGLDC